jgi:hypothetical protein
MSRILWALLCGVVLMGCSASKSSFSPSKKYSPEQLQRDYTIYQTLLEEQHPSVYWYTPKDSMDYYFKVGREQLHDSLTEPEFRKILTYVTAKVNCGHTTVRASKRYSNFADTTRIGRIFPLSMKLWEDTMVVTANANRRDSILKRATVITSINGKSYHELVDTLFDYISTDGYNRTHKFQTLSNRGFFGSLYTSLYGLSPFYNIGFIDSAGRAGTIRIPVYNPATDTFGRAALRAMIASRPRNTPPPEEPSRRDRKLRQRAAVRMIQIDSANHSAMMNLSSFGRSYGLRKFFKRSFKTLKKNDITHLIIDVRSNGGGSVTNSTSLTRYISDHRFKIADSLYAVRKGGEYGKYIDNNFFNKLFMTFFTRKRKDGHYHFGYFERHYFKPKKKNHYSGKTYILTGGNSFSATTLFTGEVKQQENVIVIGEETGGGAYGNSAWLIPDVTLPETGIRFRLPLFRLVIDKSVPKNGKGVQPEVFSLPTTDAIRRNADYKLDKAMEMIRADQKTLPKTSN